MSERTQPVLIILWDPSVDTVESVCLLGTTISEVYLSKVNDCSTTLSWSPSSPPPSPSGMSSHRYRQGRMSALLRRLLAAICHPIRTCMPPGPRGQQVRLLAEPSLNRTETFSMYAMLNLHTVHITLTFEAITHHMTVALSTELQISIRLYVHCRSSWTNYHTDIQNKCHFFIYRFISPSWIINSWHKSFYFCLGYAALPPSFHFSNMS